MRPFFYHVAAAWLVWVLFIGGTVFCDQSRARSCREAGKTFDYGALQCLRSDQTGQGAYWKARYPRLAWISIAVLLYVGAVTVFYVVREIRRQA